MMSSEWHTSSAFDLLSSAPLDFTNEVALPPVSLDDALHSIDDPELCYTFEAYPCHNYTPLGQPAAQHLWELADNYLADQLQDVPVVEPRTSASTAQLLPTHLTASALPYELGAGAGKPFYASDPFFATLMDQPLAAPPPVDDTPLALAQELSTRLTISDESVTAPACVPLSFDTIAQDAPPVQEEPLCAGFAFGFPPFAAPVAPSYPPPGPLDIAPFSNPASFGPLPPLSWDVSERAAPKAPKKPSGRGSATGPTRNVRRRPTSYTSSPYSPRSSSASTASSPSASSSESGSPVLKRRALDPSLSRFRCPFPGCEYVQYQRRGKDLKRHQATHDPNSSRFRCCGVPRERAEQYGISAEELAHMVSTEHNGVEMVGGCGKWYSRRDALKRHLRNERCLGDHRGDWLPTD